MTSQKSAEATEFGKLFIVGTPIGNLEDMTFRAVRILQEADYIAAEDTRNTIKLCNHFEITTQMISYHEHNTRVAGEKIIELLQDGNNIAIVSDAGMPCISDPGADLVELAIEQGFAVVPVPGPNAAITALVASGITAQPFLFFGFLSRQKKELKTQLENLQHYEETIIFYEAPHRLKQTLRGLVEQFGDERKIVMARELTKRFEEFLRGTIAEAIEWAESNEIRGEFCLIVEGNQNVQHEAAIAWWTDLSIKEHVERIIEEKEIRSKDAIKEVADVRELSKRDVYQAYHVG
ncbi:MULTISPECIES: 16S rRNA (cytidine(1402)-2'-O)-methyltransferase [unclassified Sporosarcina]|uniref:16S rRNA (cytidine(1402)-2'-O)-methyltransferase n=1 Tax=unclassified Sporosarcina TaxID=2647733 RepID=UPI000C16C411|nr:MULTISPECIES: 16S rRNA (cytidine(1402)-2'-O)-methyltransferase [unclassified Sporosarcina]PID01194.1 16S rRNA (cytidine(1402)-2'-O)-methyltransferase [Sporosarcina sp. P2]PID23756.1 16S rRNA (cytidine(1402)-2'-O)-methyltransferase [Sporosarcina sp. P7]